MILKSKNRIITMASEKRKRDFFVPRQPLLVEQDDTGLDDEAWIWYLSLYGPLRRTQFNVIQARSFAAALNNVIVRHDIRFMFNIFRRFRDSGSALGIQFLIRRMVVYVPNRIMWLSFANMIHEWNFGLNVPMTTAQRDSVEVSIALLRDVQTEGAELGRVALQSLLTGHIRHSRNRILKVIASRSNMS